MLLSLFIARRYLFSKKSHNAINIISGISVAAIALATAAMIIVMGVFSGFQRFFTQLYTQFDPVLVVSPVKGKFMPDQGEAVRTVAQHPNVAHTAKTLEENALILYRGHPLVIYVKGVDRSFDSVTHVRNIIVNPRQLPYSLEAAGIYYGIPGAGLARLVGLDFDKLQICAPRSGERINLSNPIESFSVEDLHATGVAFEVNQNKYDERYMLTSLAFAQKLFEKEHQVSRLELSLRDSTQLATTQEQLRAALGPQYKVLNRIEQQEDMFNIQNIERLTAYIFLSFILLLTCFSIISSLSMLIIEKRGNVRTLRHLGMTPQHIRKIFVLEGCLISLLGAVIGLSLGGIVCYLQEVYGFVPFGQGQSFILQSYPMHLEWQNFLWILLTVVGITFPIIWSAVYALSRQLLTDSK